MSLFAHTPKGSEREAAAKRWSALLKVIGAAGAAVSFLLALNQGTGVVQEFRIHRQEFAEALNEGRQQYKRSDYFGAFQSFKHASEIDPIDRQARQEESLAAMRLLEGRSPVKDRTLSDLANQFLPVLDDELRRERRPAVQADLLAHIGWANLIRYYRDVGRRGDVEDSFEAALKKDPGNVYAHAMLANWMVQEKGKLEDANLHFSAALASGRERVYVRSLQIDALTGVRADAELVRVANAMRKNGESLTWDRRHDIFVETFHPVLKPHDKLVEALTAVPPDDTLATYDWLVERAGNELDAWEHANRSFIIGNLKEIAGNQTEALSIYKSLQKGSHTSGFSPDELKEAIKRVSAPFLKQQGMK